MNYGWLTPDGPEDECQRVVLHEFGHALSALRELGSSYCAIARKLDVDDKTVAKAIRWLQMIRS